MNEENEYDISVKIDNGVLNKLFKSFKSGQFSNSKMNVGTNPLCQLFFQDNQPFFLLKISFGLSYLIIQIPTKEMKLPDNKDEIFCLIYYEDLLESLFSPILFVWEADVIMNINLEDGEFIINMINNYTEGEEDEYESITYRKQLVNNEVDTLFPNLGESDWSFEMKGKNVSNFIFVMDILAKEEERENNFFDLYLRSKEKIEIIKTDKFDNKTLITFQIELTQKSELFHFGDHFTYGTCDFSSFLNSFAQGSDEITFYFLEDGRMIIEKNLLKDWPDFRVKQQFSPIVKN